MRNMHRDKYPGQLGTNSRNLPITNCLSALFSGSYKNYSGSWFHPVDLPIRVQQSRKTHSIYGADRRHKSPSLESQPSKASGAARPSVYRCGWPTLPNTATMRQFIQVAGGWGSCLASFIVRVPVGKWQLSCSSGHLDWHSTECANPKIQAILDCWIGVALHLVECGLQAISEC